MAVIHVAVGVIINKDKQVLIAKRGSHQHQGDKWEFPGGKVEDGETSQEALSRELKEELGIEIQSAVHMMNIIHKYTDEKIVTKVLIDVYEVNDWLEEALGREGQPLRWVEKCDLDQYTFPAANVKILGKIKKL